MRGTGRLASRQAISSFIQGKCTSPCHRDEETELEDYLACRKSINIRIYSILLLKFSNYYFIHLWSFLETAVTAADIIYSGSL
jgi:hypothetical protein